MNMPLVSGGPIAFLVDRDPAVWCALKTLARSLPIRVELCASVDDFLATCSPSQPGCLLLDWELLDGAMTTFFHKLAEGRIHLPVVLLAQDVEIPAVVQAIRAGARNFLKKPCDEEILREAVEDAVQWDVTHRPEAVQGAKARRRLGQLSPGETQVLELLVEGLSNRQIADRLELSVRTIEVRRAKVMKTMRAGSLAELVRWTLLGRDCWGKPGIRVDHG